MKITLVTRERTWGGGEVLLVGIARELLRQGYDVSICAPTQSQIVARATDVPFKGPGKPELVIANDFRSLWRSGILFPTARKVFICHGWWQTSWLRNRVCDALGARVFAVSSAVADAIRAAGGVRAPIEVLPLGPDSPRFRPPTAEERGAARSAILPSMCQGIVFSWVGRFQDVKRPTMFIDLVERLGATGVMVVPERASGADEQRIRNQLVRRSSKANIILMPGGDPCIAYWASDAFVSTSRFESLGLALMEALACRLPVVTTAVGGPSDFLPDLCRIPPDSSIDLMAERLWSAMRRRTVIEDARREMLRSRSLNAVARTLVTE